MKWTFDRKNKFWWYCNNPQLDTVYYVRKVRGLFELKKDHDVIWNFKKLKSAKMVAEFMKNG